MLVGRGEGREGLDVLGEAGGDGGGRIEGVGEGWRYLRQGATEPPCFGRGFCRSAGSS